MKKLLMICHCPSANTLKMKENMVNAINLLPDLQIELMTLAPLAVTADEVIGCEGLIILTTENLGYMSGLTKDFFDRIYYPCLEACQGKPYAVVIRAGHDGTGTRRAIESICTGLKWRLAQPVLVCRGQWREEFLTQCGELAATMAASIDLGLV